MGTQGSVTYVEIVEGRRAWVARELVGSMARGGSRWAVPWACHLSPRNPATGAAYRGVNRLHLCVASRIGGLHDPRWYTFNQIRRAGWHLRRGSQATPIERWREFGDGPDGRYLRLVGYWNVFNAQDVEGPELPPSCAWDGPGAVADRLARLAGLAGPPLPAATRADATARARALLRALALGADRGLRTTGGGTAPDAPEHEALVAELGSLFCASDLGLFDPALGDVDDEGEVAHLAAWMRDISADPSYLLKAAARADRAAARVLAAYEALARRDLLAN